MRRVIGLLLPLAFATTIGGCCCAQSESIYAMAWTAPKPHAALADGAFRQGHYTKYSLPTIVEWYVVKADRSRIKTFAELRSVLRPIDTPDRALAYRELLREVELDARDDTLRALSETTPLEFSDGDSPFMGHYVRSDAERWGVAHEPTIETTAAGVVITEPAFRWRFYWDDAANEWLPGRMTVELVRETIHPDGTYGREVVRVLEEGNSVDAYGPIVMW